MKSRKRATPYTN